MKKNRDTENKNPGRVQGCPPREVRVPEVEVPEVKVPEVKVQEDPQEKLLRVKADFENTKKRLERDQREAIKFANEKLLVEILSIVDNFDWAMTSLSEGHDPEQVKKGLEIAQEQIRRVLERHGVQIVKGVGEIFDPKFHEAVATVEPSAGMKEGQIVDEIQRGYLLNGRLIRPSRVRIVQQKEGADQTKDDVTKKA